MFMQSAFYPRDLLETSICQAKPQLQSFRQIQLGMLETRGSGTSSLFGTRSISTEAVSHFTSCKTCTGLLYNAVVKMED